MLTPDEEKYIMMNNPESNFFGGMNLRNELGLWQRETPLVQFFIKTYGLGHADDISGMIMKALWAKVRKGHFSANIEAIKYKTHWRSLGIDPATLEKLSK